MMRYVGLGLLLIVVFGAGALYALNKEQVISLNLFVTTIDTPVVFALIASLALGIVIGILAGAGRIMRLSAEKRRLQRSVDLAEAEVSNLRNLPMQDVG